MLQHLYKVVLPPANHDRGFVALEHSDTHFQIKPDLDKFVSAAYLLSEQAAAVVWLPAGAYGFMDVHHRSLGGTPTFEVHHQVFGGARRKGEAKEWETRFERLEEGGSTELEIGTVALTSGSGNLDIVYCNGAWHSIRCPPNQHGDCVGNTVVCVQSGPGG